MVDVQELITRGRLHFSGAPKRLEVFKLVNGKNSTKDIARKTRRPLTSVLDDILVLKDNELIQPRKSDNGSVIKKDGAVVYEKNPVIRHVSLSYFEDVAETTKFVKRPSEKRASTIPKASHVPTETEILDICKNGESQLYDYKAPGADAENITREISGFLHTRNGGIVLYGVGDHGEIIGSDVRRQDFDQKIQNSVRNTISPPSTIEIAERDVMGSKILLVLIPPWNRKTVYQNTKDGRYYIRKGTNIFVLRPDEMKQLHRGEYIV